MRLIPRGIAARLFLATVVALAVAVLVVAVTAPLAAREQETALVAERLRGIAVVVAELAAPPVSRGDAESADALARRLGGETGTRITLVAADGTVLGESDEDRRAMENHADRPEVAAALGGGEGRAIRHSATVGRDLLYVAVPVREGARVVGASRTALPLSALDQIVARLAGVVLAAAVVGALAALVVAAALGRAIVAPLSRLTRRAERGPSDDPAGFDVRGADEIERLGSALRRMAASGMAARDAIRSEHERLSSVVTELADAVLIVSSGRIALANPAAARMLDVRDPVGRPVAEVVRDHEVLEALASARLRGDATAQLEREDPPRSVRIAARRLGGADVLLAMHDLTELRRAETMRRDLTANVSHELRTPLTSLKAMAETLEAGALEDPAAARDLVGRMHEEVDGMTQLVTELLALSRAQSGADALRLEDVDPATLLGDAAARMSPLASRAGVRLTVATTDLPRVRGDRERLAQVLTNLVHNAVKFSASGGEVTLSAEPREGAVAFSVSDRGEGIERKDLERVFERFYKSDRSRSSGGTGLGLAVAKHLVQQHGGTIWAASDGPGRGATFTFTVPLSE